MFTAAPRKGSCPVHSLSQLCRDQQLARSWGAKPLSPERVTACPRSLGQHPRPGLLLTEEKRGRPCSPAPRQRSEVSILPGLRCRGPIPTILGGWGPICLSTQRELPALGLLFLLLSFLLLLLLLLLLLFFPLLPLLLLLFPFFLLFLPLPLTFLFLFLPLLLLPSSLLAGTQWGAVASRRRKGWMQSLSGDHRPWGRPSTGPAGRRGWRGGPPSCPGTSALEAREAKKAGGGAQGWLLPPPLLMDGPGAV